MAEEEKQATYEELSTWLQEWQDKYVDLVWRHREVSERLDSIEGVYARLYKKWWMRLFYLPFDAKIEGRMLFRCQTCRGLFWKDGPMEFTRHKGHRYGPATEGNWWEGLALKLGRIK